VLEVLEKYLLELSNNDLLAASNGTYFFWRLKLTGHLLPLADFLIYFCLSRQILLQRDLTCLVSVPFSVHCYFFRAVSNTRSFLIPRVPRNLVPLLVFATRNRERQSAAVANPYAATTETRRQKAT